MRALVVAACITLAVPGSALSGVSAEIAAARKFVEPIMGAACEWETDADRAAADENRIYEISYRTRWQDQDSPDEALTLIQLHCLSAADNASSLFVTRDERGKWSLLAFAEPTLDFDYADEAFTTLQAPPRVSGYQAQHALMNAEYLPASRTIRSLAKWRDAGDAWSAGEWVLVDGIFRLTRYEVDPTFEPKGGTDGSRSAPASYVVFEAPGK